MRVETETEKIVAVLHEVVEDSQPPQRWGFDELRREGFSEPVLVALEGITQRVAGARTTAKALPPGFISRSITRSPSRWKRRVSRSKRRSAPRSFACLSPSCMAEMTTVTPSRSCAKPAQPSPTFTKTTCMCPTCSPIANGVTCCECPRVASREGQSHRTHSGGTLSARDAWSPLDVASEPCTLLRVSPFDFAGNFQRPVLRSPFFLP